MAILTHTHVPTSSGPSGDSAALQGATAGNYMKQEKNPGMEGGGGAWKINLDKHATEWEYTEMPNKRQQRRPGKATADMKKTRNGVTASRPETPPLLPDATGSETGKSAFMTKEFCLRKV